MASSCKSLFALCLAFSAAVVHSARIEQKWDITWETGAPNGEAREMIFVNGKFPGPTLMLEEGDEVVIEVHNKMPFNTTIHWHGIEQNGTPWADGVPGLTQKPIDPGQKYTYKWIAHPYGTYWYHAHSRGTLQDGLYGAIHIRPKSGTPEPFHLISDDPEEIKAMSDAVANPYLVTMSDWSHLTSWEYMNAQIVSGLATFCVDSILVNGKGNVYCPGQDFLIENTSDFFLIPFNGSVVSDKGCFPNVPSTQDPFTGDESKLPPGMISGCRPFNGSQESFEVDPASKWASFNWISAASLKTITVSIDEHPMWVYAVDGLYIEPVKVDMLSVFNGERYSVLIKLDKTPKNYTMRIADTGLDQIISEFATMIYKGGQDLGPSVPYISYGGLNVTADVVAMNATTLVPYKYPPPAKKADAFHVLKLGRLGAAWAWTMDGDELYPEDRSAYNPLLFDLNQADARNGNLTVRTQNNTWVDLVLWVGHNPLQPIQFPHPIHKHSNKAYVIGQGLGQWNWTSVDAAMQAEPTLFNLDTPMYRDTFLTSFAGPAWMVLRYHVINPGPFMLHCHIETHLEGGMAIAILDGVDHWPTVPEEYLSNESYY